MRVMIFGFDGLRPDCVTGQVMPRLTAFLEENVRCVNHKSVYPTETYVSHPSIFSGFLPERHGLIANAFFDPSVSSSECFLGSNVDRIEQAEDATRGGLFRVPTLTEVAASAGLRCVTVSSNSPGSTRLISHKTAETGGVNVSVHGLRHALPASLRHDLTSDGEDESFAIPDLEGLRRINRIYHDVVDRDGLPDLSVVWYGEPDHSFHRYGVGAAESRTALSEADRCFGEMLDEYRGPDTQIVVASDHGHITVREHFDLAMALRERGFRVGQTLSDPDADLAMLWGYSGNIYALDRNLIPKISRTLMEVAQVGMVFTADRDGVNGVVEGTFSARLVGGDNCRAGDIRFVLRHFDEIDPRGFEGTCMCAPAIPVGGGIHGGLHPGELNCLLGFGGSVFKKATAVRSVTGVIDIAPTLYRVLELEPPLSPQGRVLAEVFSEGPDSGPQSERRLYGTGCTGFAQELEIERVGSASYILRGGRTG